ncbi:MAG: TetR/AcrR family transcriptional regulator [Clostridia bacterium]|nr:TetR/AcrR family transcriptional regulator [Clostridia bacterium]
MKKGIIRREQIIETGEKLFYENGYEDTSIQQILDELQLSKGGFYHHFESKLQLLEAICARHGEKTAALCQSAVANNAGEAIAQMDALFSAISLWQRDDTAYAVLLLNTAYFASSYELRACVRRFNMNPALPLIRQIIRDGIAQGEFFTQRPDEIGELILNLFANITDDIALKITFPGETGLDLSDVQSRLEAYREAVEVLLCAPLGSMTLYSLADVQALNDVYVQSLKV